MFVLVLVSKLRVVVQIVVVALVVVQKLPFRQQLFEIWQTGRATNQLFYLSGLGLRFYEWYCNSLFFAF